jgi:hypothetical protein
MPRLDKRTALLIIMTRWHVDELVGRFIEQHSEVRILRYPAIAEVDDASARFPTGAQFLNAIFQPVQVFTT